MSWNIIKGVPFRTGGGSWAKWWEEMYAEGNNWGWFVFNDDNNVRDGSDKLWQLRDLVKENALGPELYVNNTFDTNALWTEPVNGTWVISGGKANAVNVGGVSGNLVRVGIGVLKGVYRFSHQLEAISGKWIQMTGILPSTPFDMPAPGAYDFTSICNNIALGFRKISTYTCIIDNAYCWRILGNHLVQETFATLAPKLYTDYLEFDGSNDYLKTAVTADTFGSIYIVAQKVGVDADFKVYNSLDGIGEHSGGSLTIGANAALSSYYNIRIKEIFIRTVTDDASTISKINKYYEWRLGL